MSDPQFTEQELAAILRRAAELSAADGPTYTLAEIQQIAEQAGIPAALVTQAAAEVPLLAVEPEATSGWLSSSAYRLEHRVAGTATPEQLAAALAAARQLAEAGGQVQEAAGSLTWQHDSGFRSLTVAITPGQRGTTVRLEERLDGRGVALVGGVVGAAVLTALGAASVTEPLAAVTVGVAALVPYAMVARGLWERAAAQSRSELTRLAAAILAALRGEGDRGST